MIFKAEIGDYLYIIIFVVLMLLGSLEKILRKKKQDVPLPPPSPPYRDDFDSVDEQVPAPQTIEDMMRRMMQTMETQEQEEVNPYQEYARKYSHQEKQQLQEQPVIIESLKNEEDTTNEFPAFDFDFRQAVIASEILNRKY